MTKIGDLGHFEPLLCLNASFAGHPVCGKMLGSFIRRSMRLGFSAATTDVTKDFINSPHLMHITYFTFSCLRKYLLFFTRGCVCWDERGSGLWGEDEIIV